MIRIDHVTRRYGQVVAVDDVSATIERGEVVGLLGHNGAGKTTLMKMLTGVLEPTSGSLSVAGRDLVGDRNGAQRHIGYLPESAPLYPEMEVYEYLLLMAELRGVERSKLEGAAVEAARSTGLLERLGQPIRELSKGYRQRVGIAQAIVHDPDVLILDEPTNGLDPQQIESIRGLVKRLAERTTIILSTHILQEVEAVCDRALILIGGQKVADATLTELLDTDRAILSVQASLSDVRQGLSAVGGLRAVDEVGADPAAPGFTRYACAGGAQQVPELLEAARTRGWRVAAIGREHRTLETVFKELQRDHARREVA
jgi:ABC-2 type transport system ATP-binding protein